VPKFVYFFGGGKAEGHKDMKDVLGGKGAGPRGDDQRRTPGASGLHHFHQSLRGLRGEQGFAHSRHRGRDRGDPREARDPDGQVARPGRRPAARLRALGLEVLDAGHDGHDPEPRPERQVGDRSQEQDRQRPLRQGLVPPLHPDVLERRPQHQQGPLRARAARGEEDGQGARRRRPHRGASRCGPREVQGRRAQADGQALPAGSEGAARGRARRRVPELGQPPRRHVPPPERHSRTTSAPP
jgi:hypothetical protein